MYKTIDKNYFFVCWYSVAGEYRFWQEVNKSYDTMTIEEIYNSKMRLLNSDILSPSMDVIEIKVFQAGTDYSEIEKYWRKWESISHGQNITG